MSTFLIGILIFAGTVSLVCVCVCTAVLHTSLLFMIITTTAIIGNYENALEALVVLLVYSVW